MCLPETMDTHISAHDFLNIKLRVGKVIGKKSVWTFPPWQQNDTGGSTFGNKKQMGEC